MRNCLQLRNDTGIPAMAGLLLIALCGLPLTGCLIPQDDQVFPVLPPRRNSPASIVQQTPEEGRTTFRNGAGCPGNPEFAVLVEDEDISDAMRVRWFVGDLVFQPPNVSSVDRVLREIRAPTAGGFTTALANLTAGRTELLTVYVADTEIVVSEGKVSLDARPAFPRVDGGMASDRGYLDSHTWVLDVEPCP